MIVLGIEGPVLAGKSSAIRAAVDSLCSAGIDGVATPCFVDLARATGRRTPSTFPATITDQVEAVRCFLGLDATRQASSQGEVVLLDRTCFTLLAHTWALPFVGGPDANAQVMSDLGRSVLSLAPQHVLYLDVSHREQLQRAASRGGLPYPLLDQTFNECFRKYFVGLQKSRPNSVAWLSADEPLERVASMVESYVRTLL